MTWVLLAPNGEVIASGSWQAVIEEGADQGVIQRRLSRYDGSECCPILRAGFMMAPAAMLPEAEGIAPAHLYA